MPDFNLDVGGTLIVDVTPRKLVIVPTPDSSYRRPEITNFGAVPVYVGVNKETVTAAPGEQVDEFEIPAGATARLPKRCTFATLATGSSSARCRVLDN